MSAFETLLLGIRTNRPALFKKWQKMVCRHDDEDLIYDEKTATDFCTACQTTLDQPEIIKE